MTLIWSLFRSYIDNTSFVISLDHTITTLITSIWAFIVNPAILTPLLIFIVIILFRNPMSEWLGRVTKLKAFGVEAEREFRSALVQEKQEAAVEAKLEGATLSAQGTVGTDFLRSYVNDISTNLAELLIVYNQKRLTIQTAMDLLYSIYLSPNISSNDEHIREYLKLAALRVVIDSVIPAVGDYEVLKSPEFIKLTLRPEALKLLQERIGYQKTGKKA